MCCYVLLICVVIFGFFLIRCVGMLWYVMFCYVVLRFCDGLFMFCYVMLTKHNNKGSALTITHVSVICNHFFFFEKPKGGESAHNVYLGLRQTHSWMCP